MTNALLPEAGEGMKTSRLDGTMRTTGGRYDVHFERHFDAPLERLWAAVSEPELLEGWLGGPLDEPQLAEGGNAVIQIHPQGPPPVDRRCTPAGPRQLLQLPRAR